MRCVSNISSVFKTFSVSFESVPCVYSIAQSGTWAIIFSKVQISKLLACCLGSDTWSTAQRWDHTLIYHFVINSLSSLLSAISLTISDSLRPSFAVLQPEIQDCVSLALLCTFCDCADPSSRRPVRKRSSGDLSSCLWNYSSSWRKSFPFHWVRCLLTSAVVLWLCGVVWCWGRRDQKKAKPIQGISLNSRRLGVTFFFLLLGLECEGFSSKFILSLPSEHFWLLGLWIQPGWYQREQKQRKIHHQFGGPLCSSFLPQSASYHWLFRVLRYSMFSTQLLYLHIVEEVRWVFLIHLAWNWSVHISLNIIFYKTNPGYDGVYQVWFSEIVGCVHNMYHGILT